VDQRGLGYVTSTQHLEVRHLTGMMGVCSSVTGQASSWRGRHKGWRGAVPGASAGC
jgi:hypothetical protein